VSEPAPAAPRPPVGDRLAGYPCVSHEEAHPAAPRCPTCGHQPHAALCRIGASDHVGNTVDCECDDLAPAAPRTEEPDEDQVLADRGVRAFVEATPSPPPRSPVTDYDRFKAENPAALKLAEELLTEENKNYKLRKALAAKDAEIELLKSEIVAGAREIARLRKALRAIAAGGSEPCDDEPFSARIARAALEREK
jgi:hypothetical protein